MFLSRVIWWFHPFQGSFSISFSHSFSQSAIERFLPLGFCFQAFPLFFPSVPVPRLSLTCRFLPPWQGEMSASFHNKAEQFLCLLHLTHECGFNDQKLSLVQLSDLVPLGTAWLLCWQYQTWFGTLRLKGIFAREFHPLKRNNSTLWLFFCHWNRCAQFKVPSYFCPSLYCSVCVATASTIFIDILISSKVTDPNSFSMRPYCKWKDITVFNSIWFHLMLTELNSIIAC